MMSSRGSRQDGQRRGGAWYPSRNKSESVSDRQSLFEPAGSDGTPGSTLTLSKNITPRNSKFTALVLYPRQISINGTSRVIPSAFHHFETKPPADGYRELAGLGGVNLWVAAEDD